MRRTYRICSSVLTTVWLAALCPAQNQAPTGGPVPVIPVDGPRVELSTRLWDFGKLWYGDPCTTEVIIKNVGKSALQIVNVKTSCGCTAARPSKSVLQPGEQDKMTITYNTKKGAVNVGQTITLDTTDPIEPSIQIHVKGIVQPLYECKPTSVIAFGTVTSEARQSQTLELTNATGQKLPIKLGPLPADCAFEIRLETVEEGMKYKLSATTRPPMKVGMQSAYVKLQTDDPKRPEFDVSVNAMVSDRIAILPQSIYYSESQTPGPQNRVLRVNYLKDKPIEVTSVTCTIPNIKIQTVPSPAPDSVTGMFNYVTINVTLPDWKELPQGGGQLDIVTTDSDPKYQKITVPIIKYSPPAPATAPAIKPAPPAIPPQRRVQPAAPGAAPAPGGPAPTPAAPGAPPPASNPAKP